MDGIMGFFQWTAALSKQSPYTFGLVTVITMSGIGLLLALIADIFFRILGINLGSYKKEYEDSGGLH